jgi:hypothetical protein
MLAKKTSKNQVTLPREIAKQFPEIDYFDVVVKESSIVLTPVRLSPVTSSVKGIRDKMEKLGITGEDVKDAIRWARRKKE